MRIQRATLFARTFARTFALTLLTAFLAPAALDAQGRGWGVQRHDDLRRDDAYERAYRTGYGDGERDARQARPFEFDHEKQLRKGTVEFRRGYQAGYRDGYDRFRSASRNVGPGVRVLGAGPAARGYRDPAFSRGHSEGYRRGFEDGRDRDRYDAVQYREYRSGDNGYFGGYGARDSYKNNYRDGFRQGYEEGYREGSRAGRR